MGEAHDTGCHGGPSSIIVADFTAMVFAELWSLSWGISKAGAAKTYLPGALCFAFLASFGLNCGISPSTEVPMGRPLKPDRIS
jgi:hypothetical protein